MIYKTYLVPKRVIPNILPFLKQKDQLSLEEEAETRHIASIRIHVKRTIEVLKIIVFYKVCPYTSNLARFGLFVLP